MDILTFREYCLAKPGGAEDTPFGPDVLVMKVAGKMFALCDIDRFDSINLKCDPERAVELRATHRGIFPGYHMNKKHWNTVMCDGSVPDQLILELIDHSYGLVVKGLQKSARDALKTMK